MNDDPEAVFYERTYTLNQLQLLRDCIESNPRHLSDGLSAFIYSNYGGDNDDVLFWLRFAEQIKGDHDFPEKEFEPKKLDRTTFVIREDGSGYEPQRS